MKKILFILFTILLCAKQLHGVFYQVEIYQNPQGNISCLVKDIHSPTDNSFLGEKQHDEFVSLVNRYKDRTISIIENPFRYTGKVYAEEAQNSIKDQSEFYFSESMDRLILPNIYDSFLKCGIKRVNIDHRMFVNLFFREKTPAQCFLNAFNEAYDAVCDYDDTPLLNDYYERVTHSILELYGGDFIPKLHKNSNVRLAQLVTQEKLEKEALEKFKQTCIRFDSGIIDARIMHELYVHRNTPLVFVFAGGAHVNAILDELNPLGYKKLKTIGNGPQYYQDKDVDDGIAIDSTSIFDTKELSDYLSSIMAGSEENPRSLKRQRTQAIISSSSSSQQKNQKEQADNAASPTASSSAAQSGVSAAALYAPAQPGAASASSSSSSSVAKLSAAQQKTVKIDNQDLDAALALRLLKEDSESASASASAPLPTKKGVKRKK